LSFFLSLFSLDNVYIIQVYITAIHGHVPDEMVQCVSAFLNCCYIVRRNAITTTDITCFRRYLADFHRLRQIFITTDVRENVSLPRQHALMHYPDGIEMFGSPNGTCTSQTEAKHIPVVKEPWRRSSRNDPLHQMLRTICRLDKLTALQRVFKQQGMLIDTVSNYMAQQLAGNAPPVLPWITPAADANNTPESDNDGDENDAGPVPGPRTETMIWLAAKYRESCKQPQTQRYRTDL
jgi:hypothetical protein